MPAEKQVSGKIGRGNGRCNVTGVKKTFLAVTPGSLVWLESRSRRLETEAEARLGRAWLLPWSSGFTQWDEDTLAAVCSGKKLGC